MVIEPIDDVVFVMTGEDGKRGNIVILQKGTYIPVPVWSVAQWAAYVDKRLYAPGNGKHLGLGLEENET